MELSEVIRARRSIRKYQKGANVPRQNVEKILEAAMMAPSACNTRPWEFVVVEDESKKEELMAAHPYTQMLKTATLAIVVCGRPDLQEGRCGAFFPQDCGGAIENILLQAKDLGYGTCWCGCYPDEARVKKLQSILDVTSLPMAIVAVGVPDEAPNPRGYFDPSRVKYI